MDLRRCLGSRQSELRTGVLRVHPGLPGQDRQRHRRGGSGGEGSMRLLYGVRRRATTPDDEVRQAACFQAASGKQGDDLKNLCRGKDLGDKAQWEKVAALGARMRKPGEEDYDAQQDMISCLATKRSGGVAWRKSDSLLVPSPERRRSDEAAHERPSVQSMISKKLTNQVTGCFVQEPLVSVALSQSVVQMLVFGTRPYPKGTEAKVAGNSYSSAYSHRARRRL